MDLSTVADDEAVSHDGVVVRRYQDLSPDTGYEYDGLAFRTLPRPPGELLARVATVNDLHFGEPSCGEMEEFWLGPVCRSSPGDEPYPLTMNRSAVAEMAAVAPDAVVAKGDIADHGTAAEYAAFLDLYRGAFGDRLHHVRGNHDAYGGESLAAWPVQEVALPGVRLAILDTVIAGEDTGQLSEDQTEWLDELGARTDRPVLVFGHHHCWDPGSAVPPERHFGIRPADSARLIDVFTRRPALLGYFAGHTHRNRLRHFAATGSLPWAEVACVKDFPGSWAEYRVFEGGALQIHRRISSPAALAWTERTRPMFDGMYAEYAFGSLGDRCFSVGLRGE